MPMSIATPTVMPTRWPTPMSASDREVESIVPVEPILKAAPTSEAVTSGSRTGPSLPRPGHPGDRQQAALVVLAGLLGVADLEDLSAGHTLGVWQVRTRHERATQGIEYMTPSEPPTAHTNMVCQ